jgi:hypothetical protein
MIDWHNRTMRKRRAIIVFIVGAIVLVLFAGTLPTMVQESLPPQAEQLSQTETPPSEQEVSPVGSAAEALETLEVKGKAPKTGYARDQFGDGWDTVNGCSVRNIILYRDLQNPVLDDECKVIAGTLIDSYSDETIQFTPEKSSDVQIDHVIALSDAWQKGAQLLTKDVRKQLANDPLELIAVSGKQNQAKSDGDAETWLPKKKSFRCPYVARQIAVKVKYSLWVTQAEKDAMNRVLVTCPAQTLPAP